MHQIITITRENVNDISKGLAASANRLGFRKNGKEMVPSQALALLAKLKGLNEHTLMQELDKPEKAEHVDDRGAAAFSLLRGLVNYLTRNYSDDQWDDSTREFLDEAAQLLGWEPFVWQLADDDESELAVPASERSVETAEQAPVIDEHTQGQADNLFSPWKQIAAKLGANGQPANDQSEMAGALAELEKCWGQEHGWYGRAEWREDVAQGNTKLGYWEWVQHSIESNGGEKEHCSECGKPTADGDSADGLCGNCADKAEVESDLKEDAQSLGINLDDTKFWVKRHFQKEFDDASHQQRFDWLHMYREYNGLTPVGSVLISPADVWGPRQTADKAFEDYDFGDDYTVADHNGWEFDGESILTKVVFLGDTRTPDAPTTKAIFRVQVVNGTVVDILVSGT